MPSLSPQVNKFSVYNNRTALMPSLSPQVNKFSEIRSKLSKHVFSIIDLAKWAPRITNI
jgi:hypothetical protein